MAIGGEAGGEPTGKADAAVESESELPASAADAEGADDEELELKP